MSQRPVNVCLLGASLNTGNMGVSALAAGTVTAVLSCNPEARVFLLDYGREPATYRVQTDKGAVPVDLVNIRFSKKIYLRNNIARLLLTAVLLRVLPGGLRRRLLSRNPYLKAILDAEIVASIAGGDSFSDIYGFGRLLYVALPQILVLLLDKPLILLPQTLGPFKSSGARAIAGFILRHALMVYSRDQASLVEVRPLMANRADRLRVSYDMAFVMKPVRPEESKVAGLPRKSEGRPLVGLNVSGLLFMGGYTRNNMFGLKVDYPRLIRDIVTYFVRDQSADVVLIPHVFGGDIESDTEACARLFEELQPVYPGRVHLLRCSPHGQCFNQHEIKYVIGQCDFFLGARMHACIGAVSQCVPAVCMAYSRKFAGVMKMIGSEELVVDLCALNDEAALKAIRHLFDSRARLQSVLRQRMPDVQMAVRNLFSPEKLVSESDRSDVQKALASWFESAQTPAAP